MKLLSFHYHLKIRFSEPVNSHRFTLRCMPVSDEMQRIVQLQRFVFPAEDIRESTDQWGNALLYGICRGEHREFETNVCGQAVAGLADGTLSGNAARDRLFRYCTTLTLPDGNLRELARSLPEIRTPGDAMSATEIVSRSLEYRPGVTDTRTCAAEALALGKGVCQDYAHIMLAALRIRGIPCRYAAGMLLGEGKSHAWVEVLCGGKWYAFDPTNCMPVSDRHIKLSHGRDADDCAINRGIFRGTAIQSSDISVIVTEE